ncbi:hypothetical protein [Paenibacillus sp. Soil787]|uniref:hypothetical protein n=1 Tax=Paenibacillus sp. Soil787 TaxID=1736411 RepID=UPI000702820F|nr:hypothetical protein [Paenibacillus sp. Soil787]KRF28665.1 hypothetical protein ASG93_28715 [Paenibacillus sp. Soil787]
MDFKGILISNNETTLLIEKLTTRYVDVEKLASKKLMWNSFKTKPRKMEYDIAKNHIPTDKRLYFYLERSRLLYAANHAEILAFVEELEPWEEIDAYIFDDSFEWVFSITHDDLTVLMIGL